MNPALIVGALLLGSGALILAAVVVDAVRNRRRPTPPPPVVRRPDAAPTREIPIYRVTSLPELPAHRPLDETFVMHRIEPVFDPRDALTVLIPRQRGGRHAR